jgi:hypothetical protein
MRGDSPAQTLRIARILEKGALSEKIINKLKDEVVEDETELHAGK